MARVKLSKEDIDVLLDAKLTVHPVKGRSTLYADWKERFAELVDRIQRIQAQHENW